MRIREEYIYIYIYRYNIHPGDQVSQIYWTKVEHQSVIQNVDGYILIYKIVSPKTINKHVYIRYVI